MPETAVTRRPGKFVGNDLWVLASVPAELKSGDPLIGHHPKLEPPEGGLIARITTFEAGSTYPPHQTRTLDIGVVISGEMELILDDGSTIVGPGEVVVQRATRHSWRVHGDKPCTMLFVLIAAKEQL